MNNKKGISLIVLVITILVMIILAGVVIVSLQNDNPINKAKYAKMVDSVQSVRAAVSQYAATAQAEDNVSTKMDVILTGSAISTAKGSDDKYGTYHGWKKLNTGDAVKKALGVDPSSLATFGEFWVNPSTGISVFKLTDDTFKDEATGVDGIILSTVNMTTEGVK